MQRNPKSTGFLCKGRPVGRRAERRNTDVSYWLDAAVGCSFPAEQLLPTDREIKTT